MSRTITALYDSRSDAEAARARLTAGSIDADNVRIVDQRGMVASGSASSSSSGGGIWSSLKNMSIPQEDRHTYEEAMRRGAALLCVSVDDNNIDRAIDLLDQTGSVDVDERERDWKSEGWAGYTPASTSRTGSTGMGSTGGIAGTSAGAAIGSNMQEERIQLAEEELQVGKREVTRGGARIRSYVVERPITEQLSLREEHVHVERRPVDGTAGGSTVDTGNLFQNRTYEMTEFAEEAVVQKQARVTEEIVLSKTADQRIETINDTVRKTEVEIDQGGTGLSGRAASDLDGRDDPNRGPMDRAANALGGRDDPNRGPVDRAANALDGRDDPNRGLLDRAANALGGHDDPNRGPIDRASNAINRNT